MMCLAMKEHNFSKMMQEEFLKAAFEEAARQEIAELETMAIDILKPTEEQRKEIIILLDNCTAK